MPKWQQRGGRSSPSRPIRDWQPSVWLKPEKALQIPRRLSQTTQNERALYRFQ